MKVLVFFLALVGLAQEAARPAVKVGGKAPEFTVVDLDGKALTLADLQKGSTSGAVTLTFWCTVCSSCRIMEDRLEKLHQARKEKAAVIALDANAGGETPAQIREFMKKKGFTFPVVLDAKGAVANLFGVTATTTTLVLDGKGVLRYRGRFDDRSGKDAYAGDALKAVVEGGEVAVKQTSPVG